jgi:hypothetical protein
MVWLTRLFARSLGKASRHLGSGAPAHLQTARWGEVEAYFYLRSLGYRIVARNFRTPQGHREIDIIGWTTTSSALLRSRPFLNLASCFRRWQ